MLVFAKKKEVNGEKVLFFRDHYKQFYFDFTYYIKTKEEEIVLTSSGIELSAHVDSVITVYGVKYEELSKEAQLYCDDFLSDCRREVKKYEEKTSQ